MHPLRWSALVALEQAELPPFEQIADWYADQFPHAPAPEQSSSTDNLATFTIGDFTAAATLVPWPIPWSQLEGPAATAWHWPDAADALQRHTAHLLVTLIDEAGAAVQKAMHLTRVTAALAAASPAIGVYWGPARTVHAAAPFIDQAVQLAEDNLPLYLWIDFRIENTGPDAYRLFTTGLEALGHSELEARQFAGSPQTLLEYAYNIAHYQLDRRNVIRDGDTIGVADDVQVIARRGPSMLDEKTEVIQLEFDPTEGAPE